jgi:hypothetical protein
MLELKLTSAALKALYGGGRVVIADSKVAPIVCKHVAAAFTVLSVDASGHIRMPDEETGNSACHDVHGVTGNVCAFVLTKESKAVYAEWGAEHLLARGHGGLPVLVVPHNPLEAVQGILAFLLEVQSSHFRQMAENVAGLEEQVVYLRQSSERMMTTLSVAERIMDSVGYEDITPVATLEPGKQLLDSSTCPDNCFSQVLPVDGLGLIALSLFVRAAGSGEGQVTLQLRRDFDNKPLARATSSYAALKEGWNMFRFDDVVCDVMGDVRLDIQWQDVDTARMPGFGLADAKADRFGRDGSGETLALQLFKRIFRPDLAAAETREYAHCGSRVDIETAPGFFPSRIGFYGGAPRLQAVASELPFAPLQSSDTEGWTQAHLASDGVTGVTFALPVTADDVSVSASVALDGGQALTVAAKALYVRSLDNIEAVMHALASGEPVPDTVLCHRAMLLDGGAVKEIVLCLPEGTVADGFLVVFAESLGPQSLGGWLRLVKIKRSRRLPADQRRVRPEGHSAEGRWMVRAMRLPELSGQVGFIEGPEKLDALSASLGFSPMLLEENGGYLQTHPLKDRISAAVVPMLAGAGTRKLVATATTAHPAAPDFVYVLAVRPHDKESAKVAMDKVAETAAAAVLQTGELQETEGVVWVARRLAATETARLELEFETPLDGAHDVIFATLTIDGQNSYGWCRWTSLGMISADDGSVHG